MSALRTNISEALISLSKYCEKTPKNQPDDITNIPRTLASVGVTPGQTHPTPFGCEVLLF